MFLFSSSNMSIFHHLTCRISHLTTTLQDSSRPFDSSDDGAKVIAATSVSITLLASRPHRGSNIVDQTRNRHQTHTKKVHRFENHSPPFLYSTRREALWRMETARSSRVLVFHPDFTHFRQLNNLVCGWTPKPLELWGTSSRLTSSLSLHSTHCRLVSRTPELMAVAMACRMQGGVSGPD